MSTTFKKLAGISSATFFAQFLQFLVFILVARMLGPFELGIFAVVLVVVNITVGIFDFGRTTYFTRELAFGRLSPTNFWNEVIDRVIILTAILLVVSIALLFTGNLKWALGCLLVVTQYTFQTVQALAKSNINLKKLALAIIADRFVCLSMVIGLQFFELGTVSWVVASWAMGQIIGILLLSIRAKIQLYYINLARIRTSLGFRKSAHLGAQSLSSIVVTLDQVVLGAISGPAQAGIYAAIAKWFTSFAILGNSFGTVALNNAANKGKNFSEFWRSEVRILLVVLISCIAVIVISFFFGREIIDFTIGPEFEMSSGLLPILSASATFALIGQVASASLQYYGLEKMTSRISILSGSAYVLILAIVLNLISGLGALVLSTSQLVFQSCLAISLLFVGVRARRRGLI